MGGAGGEGVGGGGGGGGGGGIGGGDDVGVDAPSATELARWGGGKGRVDEAARASSPEWLSPASALLRTAFAPAPAAAAGTCRWPNSSPPSATSPKLTTTKVSAARATPCLSMRALRVHSTTCMNTSLASAMNGAPLSRTLSSESPSPSSQSIGANSTSFWLRRTCLSWRAAPLTGCFGFGAVCFGFGARGACREPTLRVLSRAIGQVAGERAPAPHPHRTAPVCAGPQFKIFFFLACTCVCVHAYGCMRPYIWPHTGVCGHTYGRYGHTNGHTRACKVCIVFRVPAVLCAGGD